MLDIIDHPSESPAENIRELRLNRPPVNALDGATLAAISAAVEKAASECAALVITGKPGLFSGGLDVPALLHLDREGIADAFGKLWRAQRAIALSPIPVVFGLTGHSPAGGTVLAIHGDYRVMAQSAIGESDFKLGLNEVQVGLYPGGVIHGAFRRLVGGHAAQLLTRGALIDPAMALRVGLVDEICAADAVSGRALAIAREFAALPRAVMLKTRTLMRAELVQLFGDAQDGARHEAEFSAMGADTWFQDATQALLKRTFAKRTKP